MSGGWSAVTPGETITGINASIDIGGRIAGIVTDVFNTPLFYIPVTAFDLNYQWMGSAPTDSNGNYGFSVPAGNYKVFFDSNPSDYYVLSEWNDDKASFETADVISVATGETSDVSVELAASGKISGRVTDGINGIQGVSVAACYSDGTCLYGAETDSDGNYILKAPAGSWKVYFNNYRAIGYFVNEWFDNQSTSTDAVTVQVTAGEPTLGINPNPFNPVTTIMYDRPEAATVRMSVFNMLGQEVRVLVNEHQEPGFKRITFDASGLSTGVYVYRITTRNFVDMKKLVFLR